MAKFLTTIANSHYIEQIILKADKHLTLLTPYLSLSKNLLNRLLDADKKNINITLIYGKSELSTKELDKIDSLSNIEVYFCKDLHAKCYFNEDTMVISSMNLYEFSEKNNREMGVLIKRDYDTEIYFDTIREVDSIKNSSILEKTNIKNDPSKLIHLDKNKNDIFNYYKPSLFRVLKNIFSNYNVIYEDYENIDYIIIEKYPTFGSKIQIRQTVGFYFKNRAFFNYFEENVGHEIDKLEKESPDIKFYWNYYRINFKLVDNYDYQINQEGLVKVVNLYSEIIIKTKNIIDVAYIQFRNK